MKFQTNRLFAILVLATLSLSLSHCGQKGGLTRPEASALTATSFISGK